MRNFGLGYFFAVEVRKTSTRVPWTTDRGTLAGHYKVTNWSFAENAPEDDEYWLRWFGSFLFEWTFPLKRNKLNYFNSNDSKPRSIRSV